MKELEFNNKILYVDDEENLLSAFKSLFRKEPYDIHLLHDPTNIGNVLKESGPFAVVISDQRMPNLDGVGLLELVSNTFHDTVRIMMTGYSDYEDTKRAINQAGIFQYLQKPWNDTVLKTIINESVLRYNLVQQNKMLNEQVAAQNKELEDLLDGTVNETVQMLSDLLEHINPHASKQTERIKKLAIVTLDLLPPLSAQERRDTLLAFNLYNIGLATLPSWIQVTLNKDGLSSLDRFPVARNHQLLAYELLKNIPKFENVARIIQFSHKNFDGTGEPVLEPVHSKNIPLGSRILHILIDMERFSSSNFRGKEVLKTLLQKQFKYDDDIINTLLGNQQDTAHTGKETAVTVDKLTPGMMILENINTNTNQLIIRAGTVLTQSSITLLQHWHQHDPINGTIQVMSDIST
jgi:response regulator RpfG family c-di-GMP phosphodiesterase